MRYMIGILVYIILSLSFSLVATETSGVIRTAAELANRTLRKGPYGRPFELHAIAVSESPLNNQDSIIVADASGQALLSSIIRDRDPHILPGDRIIASGQIMPRRGPLKEFGFGYANCTNITFISHGMPIRPIHIKPEDVDSNRFCFHLVQIQGILADAQKDEIDPRYVRFVLDCEGQTINGAIKCVISDILPLIGATLQIRGIIVPSREIRPYGGRLISVAKLDDMDVLFPPTDDMFLVPEPKLSTEMSLGEITSMGKRKVTGRVLAVWNGDMMLLRTADDNLVTVNLITAPPAVGDCVDAVGKIETNLYHIYLMRSIWRKSKVTIPAMEKVRTINVCDLFLYTDGGDRMAAYYLHGKTIRLTGKVQEIFSNERGNCRITLESKGNFATIESNTPIINLNIGCAISVTGVCVLETETWNRNSFLPRTLNMLISVRSPEDVKILSTPSWWTPARLMAAIITLAMLLAGVLAWNISLRKLSERRGRELFRNQIVRAESELRIDERTRLAVELHDHLAQNLTAIAYQLASAKRSQTSAPEASSRHLSTAHRMLGSCRTELRRCLWDLRSDALNEPDIALAIRKSIEPVAEDAIANVSFPVQRTKLSDSTVHAILGIVRELTANAVNHGKAGHIKVEGEMTGGILRFSVTDDGCGFDPSSAPDAANGHFGLDGIRERLRKYNGSMSVESAPGKGCLITIVFASGKPQNEQSS